ncbi:MAG TPA: glycosyltransferase family 39 protein [Patescibacteria group bacterium]
MARKWILVLIVSLGFLLRVIGLNSVPAGFTPDEASFGYDAYSILKTGKDQWGVSFPLILRSFGDSKLPLYSYLDIPFIAVFGLNETATRLPNAVLGSLALVAVYFLVKKLSTDKTALLASFLVAISPWHIMLSRGAFEANLTTFFLPLGILLFIEGIKRPKLLVVSALVFGLNMFSYHTARLLTPLIVGYLIFNYRKEIKIEKYTLFACVVVFLFLASAVYFYIIGSSRIASSSIFSLVSGWSAQDRYQAILAGEANIVARTFNNKLITLATTFTKNYLSYFSPQFLFTNGPNEGTYGMVPGVGVLYLFDIVSLVGLIVGLIRGQIKNAGLFIFWVLISPIPASLTTGPGFAANRVAFMMPALQILLAFGLVYLYRRYVLKFPRFYKQAIVFASVIVVFLSFAFNFEKYVYAQRVSYAPSMIYGTKEVVDFISKEEGGKKEVIISKSVSEPQIYLAFYKKIDPREYQSASRNWELVNGWVDQQGSYNIGKYIFRDINYNVDSKLKNIILVGKPSEFPTSAKIDFVVNYPNLTPAYYIVSTK